jgi:hypothetical protein
MFNYLEKDLRIQGKTELADAIKALHSINGEDIPFPREELTSLIRFSPEQRKALEHKGYIVYQLTGQTIAKLRYAGHPFLSLHQGDPFERVASMRTDVAVNPRSLFLKNSNRKTLDEQLVMINKFANKIGHEVNGVTAILGSAPDYAELVFTHAAAADKMLFGKENNYGYTRTATITSAATVSVVGWIENNGLNIDEWGQGDCLDTLWVAPLIVPSVAVVS